MRFLRAPLSKEEKSRKRPPPQKHCQGPPLGYPGTRTEEKGMRVWEGTGPGAWGRSIPDSVTAQGCHKGVWKAQCEHSRKDFHLLPSSSDLWSLRKTQPRWKTEKPSPLLSYESDPNQRQRQAHRGCG